MIHPRKLMLLAIFASLTACFVTRDQDEFSDLDPIDREFLETLLGETPADDDVPEIERGDENTAISDPEATDIADEESANSEEITDADEEENSVETERDDLAETGTPDNVADQTTDEAADPQPAPVTASNADLALAERAVAICAQNFPNNEAARQTLLNRGFTIAGGDSRVSVLVNNRETVAVTVSRGEPLEKICAITVANMSSDQGIALIQPWVRLTKGKPSKRLSEKAAAA
ncbi:MAG: hypothetical protein AAGA63_12205, partial [Pseudomonadota bacterium]